MAHPTYDDVPGMKWACELTPPGADGWIPPNVGRFTYHEECRRCVILSLVSAFNNRNAPWVEWDDDAEVFTSVDAGWVISWYDLYAPNHRLPPAAIIYARQRGA